MMVFLQNLWAICEALGVWFLLGLLIAGLMHLFVPAGLFQRWLGKSSFANVVKAAFIGVPMPLCSCGVVPTVLALKKKGASKSSCLSFLVSTPQTGVDSLMVSASFLSWPFAFFKLASAFVIGIFAGCLHHVLAKSKPAAAGEIESAQPVERSSVSLKELYDFAINDLFYNLWRWMFVGLIAAALIATFVSEEFLGNSLFADPLMGSIAALFLSIPLYVCATSSVPIAAALVAKGMSPAVAIVFLIAGPATNIATIGLIYKSFGRLFTVVYLLSVSVGSVICAVLFASVIQVKMPEHIGHHHGESSSWLVLAGAVAFVGFLLLFALRDAKTWLAGLLAKGDESIELDVDGMGCQGCVSKIRAKLVEEKLASSVVGDPANNKLTITGIQLDKQKLRQALAELGYELGDDGNL
ncbi:permease [Persicirhabdus sediminis]|nr:permease [Persicirhabdus sediminis]